MPEGGCARWPRPTGMAWKCPHNNTRSNTSHTCHTHTGGPLLWHVNTKAQPGGISQSPHRVLNTLSVPHRLRLRRMHSLQQQALTPLHFSASPTRLNNCIQCTVHSAVHSASWHTHIHHTQITQTRKHTFHTNTQCWPADFHCWPHLDHATHPPIM